MKSMWQMWLRARLSAANLIEDRRGIAATEFAVIVLSDVVTAGVPAATAVTLRLRHSNQKAALTARPFLVDTDGISKVSAFASRTERDSFQPAARRLSAEDLPERRSATIS
jgi:hypothetical protein